MAEYSEDANDAIARNQRKSRKPTNPIGDRPFSILDPRLLSESIAKKRDAVLGNLSDFVGPHGHPRKRTIGAGVQP